MTTRPVVYLHIGLMKSGTSFIQDRLASNTDGLAEQGTLWPGHSWQAQVAAAEELVGVRASGQPPHPAGSWQALVDEINAWQGRSAIVSMEFLSFASTAQARRAAASFPDRSVEVIITARDLARVIPAQWQEAVQNRATIGFAAYVDGVLGRLRRPRPAVRHFWRAQNLPRIVGSWAPHVDRVTVVTVPPPTSPVDLLWSRFCSTVDLDAAALTAGSWSNESLGAASADLMRRLNTHLARRGIGWEEYDRAFKWLLAKDVLARRRRDEPALELRPRDLRRAATLGRVVAGLTGRTEIDVVGSLDELIPGGNPTITASTHASAPARREPPSEGLVLATAVSALHEVAWRVGRDEEVGTT